MLGVWRRLVPGVFALGWMAGQGLWGQGCIAVRGTGSCILGLHEYGGYLGPGDWQAGVAYRWIRSDRHFRGDHEEPQRQALGTEVINDQHFFDLSALYAPVARVNLGLTLPFVYSTRSSLYEHKGNASGERYTTTAGGLADLRAAAYVWLWDPAPMPRGNVSVGLGAKFPTGDYGATDTFQTNAGPVERPVDQSIQPGDGGWGMTLEITAFRELWSHASAYAQASYLFNPGNFNTTLTNRRNPYEEFNSITDQYSARAGLSYLIVPPWGLSLSLGGRIDGVPVEDAIGDSDGFRRPGYAVYVEPNLQLARGPWLFSLSAPVAVYRNREQSLADMRWGADTGRDIHGDAAFADFLILANISRQF